MTAQISAYGRLVADPQARTTSTGTPMTTARLAVSLPCHAAQDGQATFWLGVVAFGRQAEALARHEKGDMVSVVGNMQVSQWTGQDGSTQSGYQVIADAVVSAKAVRPAGKRKSSKPAQGLPPAPEDEDQRPPFDDDIPF
ncbi:single-stranded DNA-binding protein [Edwardsiella hoshinae]|uniref:Single-stranded DNA-binding protein n=1 Tax=Edwardsiella hoshinae TaxID=93378 RepID=A0A376D7P8_9GAMM|nr:single-stranded DNA-binding protein [Edwardsiella hoshinae]QPR28567.1 single-stranded DNA-binding protein [Edwardsiella hoshinae]STC82802.1 Helix-destabilizing protein [Edwardsiella hoshinae]